MPKTVDWGHMEAKQIFLYTWGIIQVCKNMFY